MRKIMNDIYRGAQNPLIERVIVFAASFVVFAIYQAHGVFADPDGFYHIKMAQYIWGGRIVTDFPWLSDFTVLGESYADQHFLYHVLLAPFVGMLPVAFGAKLATALFSACFMLVMLGVMRRAHIRYRYVWLSVLLITAPWVFRMSLVKASSAALILLFLGVIALQSKKPLRLFVVAALYPLTHGGFLLLLIMVSVWIFAESIVMLRRSRIWRRKRKAWWVASRVLQNMVAVRNLQMIVASVVGIVVGILSHPSFPRNVRYTWQQFVEIGIVNYQDVIRVGGEWYPYASAELIPNTVFVSLAILFGVLAFAAVFREQKSFSVFTLLMTILTLIMTLKSRRYVEYYVPFAVLFGATSVSRYVLAKGARHLMREARRFAYQRFAATIITGTYVAMVIPVIIGRDAIMNYRQLSGGQHLSKYADAMAYVEEHAAPGSVVMHSDWDEFPLLFYHNDQQHYVAGLDPTFAYLYDKATYDTWTDITNGTYDGDLARTMLTVFHSDTAFIATDHAAMMLLFERSKKFTRVYEDDEAVIYHLQ